MATIIKPKLSSTSLSVPTTGDLVVGELAMNLADGKFYSKTVGGVVKEMGGSGSAILNDITANGNITNQDIILNGSDLVFEGNLANAFETNLTALEPTSDRVISLPNVSGTVITTGNLTTDGTSTGDALVGEGDALAYAIVFGG
ncbi:MAG: hypothetical protein ACKVJK_18775 [Methylophagaceae bacterium]|jgi:hypothetical protein|tara:strand:+ start:188 stop:619 length:432 start_codon:yes stop_codon:yes gene_type:complete